MSGTVPPGAPGLPPRWTSSAKSGVGTAGSAASRIWFTLSHGILNEVYFPRIDVACTRDLGFLVTAPGGYFSEEKRDADSAILPLDDGVPAYRLVNTARDGRYRITKTVIADPARNCLLQDVRFEALQGRAADYRVHALLASHLANRGTDNTAWVGDYKGVPMLFASSPSGIALALAASVPWRARSVGYVGTSDAWQTLQHGEGLDTDYLRAEAGNVALAGTLDLAGDGGVLLALGFGARWEEAAFEARASLHDGIAPAVDAARRIWQDWQAGLVPLDRPRDSEGLDRYRIGTAMLSAHRTGAFSGGAIAGLSIPWGFNKGDEDLGGYHLVWPRDLAETAGGFLAAGSVPDARAILDFLLAVQEGDGHWSQNIWIDGRPYWDGIQMDETAFPILVYDMLARAGAIAAADAPRYLPAIRRAAAFVVRNGPVTAEDRWEEDAGYSPFTLSVEIAALLAAADALDAAGDAAAAAYLRETADGWHAELDDWIFATGTALANRLGIPGYYVRIGVPAGEGRHGFQDLVPIRNRRPDQGMLEAGQVLSPDALALVRFGLRAADDPRMLATVKAIDSELRRELPAGSYWYRYTGDGYGEHEDGAPFDGTGVGRLWPLLSGERAHYELAAGRRDEAERLLAALEASAGPGGLLPEQIWDAEDLPARELLRGRPSGSAMPLVWAHAEHIKLLRSLRDGAVFDTPPQTVERYLRQGVTSNRRSWRPDQPRAEIAPGQILRLELLQASRVRWSADGWSSVAELATSATGLGLYVCDLPTESLPMGTNVGFRIAGTDGSWPDTSFTVLVRTDA